MLAALTLLVNVDQILAARSHSDDLYVVRPHTTLTTLLYAYIPFPINRPFLLLSETNKASFHVVT